MFQIPTFKSILDRHRGIGPGFDVLRIGLALAIFYGHTLWVAGTAASPTAAAVTADAGAHLQLLTIAGWDGPKRPLHVALVPMFFALSGFLVSGSAIRLPSVRTFLANRLLRIFPALIVELTLSAFILGATFTDLPAREYFAASGLLAYFGNVVGYVTLTLPGVFTTNPVPNVVNVNLWTLPAEFDCYLLISIAIVVGALRRRVLMLGLLTAASIVLAVLNGTTDFAVTVSVYSLHTITFYFFVGVLFYLWRDKIPFSWPLFALCACASYLLLMSRHTVYLAPVFVTYCTIFLGLVPVPKIKLISSGDYSYGLYLYGFPISQAFDGSYSSVPRPWLCPAGSGVHCHGRLCRFLLAHHREADLGDETPSAVPLVPDRPQAFPNMTEGQRR